MLPQVNYFIPPSEKEGMIVAEIREEIKWLGISEERCWPSGGGIRVFVEDGKDAEGESGEEEEEEGDVSELGGLVELLNQYQYIPESTEGSAVELLRQQKLIKISPSSNGNHFIPRNALTTTLLLSSLLLDY
ncbi:hypothetical protein LguiB_003314 [Lonicera macranthoides]